MKKLVIFDIDGTLTNTKKVDDRCYMQAFEQTFGVDISHQSWHQMENVTDWGITEELIVRLFGRTPVTKDYLSLSENFLNNLTEALANDPSQFREVKGAKKFFDYLKAQTDYYVGVATGGWKATALLKLNAIDLTIQNLPFAHSNLYKTRQEILQNAIEQGKQLYQQEFDQVVYFGDGVWDYKVCLELGLPFIGIDSDKSHKLAKLGVQRVFTNYTNIDLIMQGLVE